MIGGVLSMRKNDIYILKDEIYRILQIKDDNCLVINCNGNSMPIVTVIFVEEFIQEEEKEVVK